MEQPKRQVPRLIATLPIRLPDGWRGEVLNLSATGLRVRTMALLAVDSVLDAVVDPEGRAIGVSATVVWAEPPNFKLGVLGEIGLQLEEPSQAYLELIADLFASE